MAISLVGSESGDNVGVGVTCDIPAGVLSGDRLLAIVASNDTAASHLNPAGWQVLASSVGSVDGGSQVATIFTRVAATGDAGTQVVFECPGATAKDCACIIAYRGGVATPVVVDPKALAHSGTATTTIATPTITVDETPATLVTLASKKGGTTEITFTPPTTGGAFTQRISDYVDGSGAIAVVVADRTASGTGATSVGTWGSSVSSASATGFLLAIREGTPPALVAPVMRRYDVGGWYPAP